MAAMMAIDSEIKVGENETPKRDLNSRPSTLCVEYLSSHIFQLLLIGQFVVRQRYCSSRQFAQLSHHSSIVICIRTAVERRMSNQSQQIVFSLIGFYCDHTAIVPKQVHIIDTTPELSD